MTSEYSPEHTRRFKPENTRGCCGNGANEGCNTPSRALEGTPLWEWEQVHGKLVTYFALRSDENGHTYKLVERIPCPVETRKTYESSCCSVRYKVVR
jgi:hypothetical protein